MSYNVKIAVALARDVYCGSNKPPLPTGVSRYLGCPEEFQKNGYCGASYYIANADFGPLIVIAHRGTDNLDGVIEDAEMDLFHEIPSQFYNGAVPFIDYILENIAKDYPDQIIQFTFTGHSLGATLSELSCVRYSNNHQHGSLLCWEPTYVFDSPGSKDLVNKQLANKEITEQDVELAGYRIFTINAEIDAINTCMQTSSVNLCCSYMGKYASPYISLSSGAFLPYDPDHVYYFHEYTLKDQHPIVNIYDRVMRNYNQYYYIHVDAWPIGFHTGYSAYKTYYGRFPPESNLYYHNVYWDQYTDVYWDQNPQIHNEYDNNEREFKDFYYKNVCYYYDGYALSKELSYKFNIADMQRIARILSVESTVIQFHAPTNHKEEKPSRICCGISFFSAINSLQRAASSAVDVVDRVVAESGEELERVASMAKESQYLFFIQVDRLINCGEEKLVSSPKSQASFGMKKQG